jgi:thiamine biosynthesis lipoprotein
MISSAANVEKLITEKRSLRLMGNIFSFTALSHNHEHASGALDHAIAEVQRIEKLFTTFDENSQTNLINNHAGISAVQVDREVFDLIKRSIRISELTQGAFDITYGSIDKSLWNFDRSMTSLPDPETAQAMVHLIDFRNIILNERECTVMLRNKGMRIGFGGIGKGYAADRAKKVMIDCGIDHGVVNAAGDLTVWGHQENETPWTISIAHPDTKMPFSSFPITNMSVATSGNYEKFVIIDGKRYSHTIDPKTGLPVQGIKSVTVISPIAEVSDAMATPITVMGISAGIHMINQMKDIACIIIDDNNRIHTSKTITLQKHIQQ